MFPKTIRTTTIALVTLSLSLIATNASAQRGDDTPWMVQLVLESSPDGFEVMEKHVVDCEGRDWKNGGSGIRVDLVHARSGETIVGYQMRDPRMVFVEPPDESKWFNEELVASGDVLMFPSGFHVLSFPVSRGAMPELPLLVRFISETGEQLLLAEVNPDDVVPGDMHGCAMPEPTLGANLGPQP